MQVRKYEIVEEEIRKAVSMYTEPGGCFEVRLIGKRGKSYILHGYFQDAETLIRELKKQRLSDTTVTISLNQVSTAKMSADGRNSFVGGTTTQDKEIAGYANVLIDFDPDRPSGISSTEEERKLAYDAAVRCFNFLKSYGFAPPVVTMSGNGYHLLYAVRIRNDEAGTDLIKRFLKTLSILMSAPGVKVDTTNYNPSRVLKLPGTWAVKGADTEERPHRLARIISAPEHYREIINDVSLIQAVADEIKVDPEEEKRQKRVKKSRLNSTAADGTPDFDLLKWLSEKIPDVDFEVEDFDDGRKIVLEHCLFDESHAGKDAVLLWFNSGAIVYKCLHNSCADKTWGDVIDKYDPDLRTKMAQEYRERNQSPDRKSDYHKASVEAYRHESPKTAPLTKEDFMERLTDYKSIRSVPRPAKVRYRTGFKDLDDKLKGGLQVDGISIVTGLSGSCKSTFISNMLLNMVEDGRKIFLVSGELADYQVQDWLDVMAAGPGAVCGKDKLIDITESLDAKVREYALRDEFKPLVDSWLDGHLWLYRNRFGYDYNRLSEVVRYAITELGVDVVMVDNLMCLTVDMDNEQRWRAQGAFCWKMHDLAQETHTHIIVCAHPKKPSYDHLLDMYGISGSSDVPNAADNVIVVHRTNDTFKNIYAKQYKSEYMPITVDQAASGVPMPGNCVKLEKSRYGSSDDEYIPLWYDARCMRLLNDSKEIARPKRYKWELDYMDSRPQKAPVMAQEAQEQSEYSAMSDDDPFGAGDF